MEILNFAGGLKTFFRNEKIYSSGIFLAEDKICYVRVKIEDDKTCKVVFANQVYYSSGYQLETRREYIEELQYNLAKSGVFPNCATLYIHEAEVYYYRKKFPFLDQNQLKDAIHWDFADNEPFNGDCIESYMVESEDDSNQENSISTIIGGISRTEAKGLADDFQSAGIELNSFVTDIEGQYCSQSENVFWVGNIKCECCEYMEEIVADESMQHALYAAVAEIMNNGLIFRLKNNTFNEWKWLRLSACVLAASFLLVTGMCSSDWLKLYHLNKELPAVKQELLLLSDVQQSMEQAEEINGILQEKGELLHNLSQDSWPVYSLLVHLGCNTSEGTWLTDVVADKGRTVIIKGKSVSYNSMVQYFKQLENDKDFFAGGAVLDKSEQDADGKISFQIKLLT